MKKPTVLFMSILMLFVLTACGNEDPTQAVEDYLDNVKSGDVEVHQWLGIDFNAMVADEDAHIEFETTDTGKKLNEMVSQTEYEIIDEKTNGDTSDVTVKVNGVNFYDILHTFSNRMVEIVFESMDPDTGEMGETTAEELDAFLITTIEETPFTEREGIIQVEKRDDEWVVVNEEDLGLLIINFDTEALEELMHNFNERDATDIE